MSSNRDMAYAIVKRMKATYSKEGCDWQREIEAELRAVLGEEDGAQLACKCGHQQRGHQDSANVCAYCECDFFDATAKVV